VLGFSIVFALLGVLLNGVLSAVAASVQMWLARLGGAIVIFFGLYLMKLFRVPFLEYNHGMRMGALPKSKMLTSLLLGFAFAVGWTPCVGAVLGGIIGLAAAAPGKAFVLLISYAIGLGVPFLIVGAFAGEATRFLNRSAVIASYITPIFGFLLVILGILVFTESLSLVANFGFLNKLLLL
jgi:cytochrome c-type biogenesis protein